MRGLKLFDDQGNEFAWLDWCTPELSKDCSWETQRIPKGSEIIGLQCNTDLMKDCIPRFGFILWQPQSRSIIANRV